MGFVVQLAAAAVMAVWVVVSVASGTELRGLVDKRVGRRVSMYTNSPSRAARDPCREYMIMGSAGVTHVVVGGYNVASWNGQEETYKRRCREEFLKPHGTKLMLAVDDVQGTRDVETWVRAAVDGLFDGIDLKLHSLWKNFGADEAKVYDLVNLVKDVRRKMNELSPSRRLEFSVATEAKYFSAWAGYNRGFVEVAKTVNDDVDHYFLQYFDGGDCEYTTYESIFVKADCSAAESSISEIQRNLGSESLGQKLQVGKLVFPSYGVSGYVGRADLRDMLCKAEREIGYTGGIGGFEFRPLGDEPDSIWFVNEMAAACPMAVGSAGVLPPKPETPTEKETPVGKVEPEVPTEKVGKVEPEVPTEKVGKVEPEAPTEKVGKVEPAKSGEETEKAEPVALISSSASVTPAKTVAFLAVASLLHQVFHF